MERRMHSLRLRHGDVWICADMQIQLVSASSTILVWLRERTVWSILTSFVSEPFLRLKVMMAELLICQVLGRFGLELLQRRCTWQRGGALGCF